MASLLTDPLFEISGRGPPPNKNFYHFSVTKSQVIWRWWKISPRVVDRYSKPGEEKESHSIFLDDTELQREVRTVFGQKILEFTKALCQGHYNFLERSSNSILLRIINCSELEDVGQLGRTSRKFRQSCESEEFWEQAMRRRCCSISAEVASSALDVGWRKVFFTNKLQLQKSLSRRRSKAGDQQEGHDCDGDTATDETLDSEEEHLSDIICHQGAGAEPDLNSSSWSDVSPDPEQGWESTKHLADHFKKAINFSDVEALTQNRKSSKGLEDGTEQI